MTQRAASYSENGYATGRPSWKSSLLGDADATSRTSPASRSTLRPKRAALRAPQGFAPPGMRELNYQGWAKWVIKVGQIRLTESYLN